MLLSGASGALSRACYNVMLPHDASWISAGDSP